MGWYSTFPFGFHSKDVDDSTQDSVFVATFEITNHGGRV